MNIKQNNYPIGVFDSGVGGLTVLQELTRQLPRENFVYVADKGHCPYGTKTPEEIAERVQKVTRFLLSKQVKAIVIACNTASAQIQSARELTDIPVISVIEPTAAYAAHVTKTKKVIVLATQATIDSGIYQHILWERGVTAIPLACGEFVDFIENHEISEPMGWRLVADKLKAVKGKGADVLIHGCTHFSLLEGQMRSAMGDNINYIACGTPTAGYLSKLLKERDLLSVEKGSQVEIYTTAGVPETERAMGWYRSPHLPVGHVSID